MPENTTEEKINRAVLVGLASRVLEAEECATEESMEELAALVRPHPTFAEGISEAVESGLGLAIHQLNR